MMISKNDALSNVEWIEDNVFEDYWAMGAMISKYDDSKGIMHVMIKIGDKIESKRRKKEVNGSSQYKMSCYYKLSKELHFVSEEINVGL